MKINPFGTQGINPYNRQMNKIDQANRVVNKSADKVEISSTALEMQQVSQVSDARMARIEELKNQVENGTYQVDARQTAKSIIDFYSQN